MLDIQESEELQETSVSISDWVEKANADPATYLERQAIEVFLSTVGMVEPYSNQMFLKGGILMAVAYESPRNTGDVDLSTTANPEEGIAERMKEALDAAFPSVCADLGYPSMMCAVQSFKYYPKGEKFPKNQGPSIKMKIGYALRGSSQQKHFDEGRSFTTLDIDVSFKEPIGAIQILNFKETEKSVKAYSLVSLMAEKFRALLQQEIRDRYRRQDVYDLYSLITRFPLDGDEKTKLLKILQEKCVARKVVANRNSLEQEAIVERAKADWRTLKLEIGDIPDFDTCFCEINAFYKSLPW